MNFTRFKTITT